MQNAGLHIQSADTSRGDPCIQNLAFLLHNSAFLLVRTEWCVSILVYLSWMWEEGVQPRREEGIGTGRIARAFEQLNEPSHCVKRSHSEDEVILRNIWCAVPSKKFL